MKFTVLVIYVQFESVLSRLLVEIDYCEYTVKSVTGRSTPLCFRQITVSNRLSPFSSEKISQIPFPAEQNCSFKPFLSVLQKTQNFKFLKTDTKRTVTAPNGTKIDDLKPAQFTNRCSPFLSVASTIPLDNLS